MKSRLSDCPDADGADGDDDDGGFANFFKDNAKMREKKKHMFWKVLGGKVSKMKSRGTGEGGWGSTRDERPSS